MLELLLLADALPATSTITVPVTPITTPTTTTSVAILPPVTIQSSVFDGQRDTPATLQPISVMTRQFIQDSGATTLGELSSQTVGVHQTGYTGGASRPIIRGQDGARVTILNNGLLVNDVSTLSPDHRVAVDILGASQVEILRGANTLRYGNGTTGGIVNVMSDAIATQRTTRTSGDVLLRGQAAGNTEQTAGFQLKGGAGAERQWVWFVSASDQQMGDYRIPKTALTPMLADQQSVNPSGRLQQSAQRQQQHELGLTWIYEQGRIGVSHQQLGMQYGVPAERYRVSEQDITPDERTRLMMRQQRTQWLVEHDQPLQGVAQVRVQYEVGQYQHQEFANGEEAAVFRNQQKEGRIEAQLNRHMIGASEWRNVVGAQHRARRFAATGAESPIVPATTSRDTGLFWISELDHQHWRIEGGLRQSQVQHQPHQLHDVQQSVIDASRQFSPRSMSLGAQWKVVPNQYVLGVQWQRSDRAPSIEELYVNGAHEGTRTYETGNAQLALERSQQVELSAAKISGDWQGRVSHYQQRFSNYIYGQLTGDRVDETGAVDANGDFRALNYQQAAARYMGNEAELWWRKMQLGWSARGFADAVRGHLNDANLMQGSTVLPRLPAQRIGLELHYRQERYRTHISWTHVARVDRLATYETPTAGYDLVNLGAEYTLSAAKTDGERRQWIAFATIRNALNEDIRLHTSFTKEFVPQAGRAVVFGVRGVF